jgi:hypothetical protein
MPSPRFLVAGHSHAVCIVEALRAADGPDRHGYARLSITGAPTERAPLLSTAAILARSIPQTLARSRNERRLVLPPLRRAARQAFNDQLVRRTVPAALAQMINAKKKPALSDIASILRNEDITILAAVGGVSHNILGTADVEVPFDFVLPAREDLSTEPSKDLVPYRLVRELLERRISRVLPMITRIRDLSGGRMLVLESPPPVEDDEHVRKSFSRHFQKRDHSSFKVTNPSFRYKIWRVSSEIYLDFCSRESLSFVDAPSSSMENGMFLRREGWRDQDSIHGNAWYGAQVVQAATALLFQQATAELETAK